ncbi:MAG: UDP-2,4-diacetamido-2,4,6-trideoxy-beta-L-altropyranose hydrolase [bacterium]
MKRQIIFRVDGGPHIGWGHIRRCLSLAEGLREKAIQSIFITRDIDQEIGKRITSNGHLIERLPAKIDLKEDLNLTIKLIRKHKPDLVITDSYEINQHYLEELKRLGVTLMSIDDLAKLHFCSDIVLNQNIEAKLSDYSTERYTKLLLGAKYALLKKELRGKHGLEEIKEIAKNILITLGGSDLNNQTLKAVKALKRIKNDIEITVIIGPGYQYEEILRKEMAADNRFLLLRDPQDIFNLMERADLSISAGGSTCYELAYLGVPNIILVLADNQKKLADGLDNYGNSVSLGWFEDVTEESIKEAVEDLIDNKARREEMSRKGRELVDGRGVERVANEMEAATEKKKRPVITEEIIQAITHKIVRKIHPDKIILFGSYADGTPHHHSDIDLFVIVDSHLRRDNRSMKISRLFPDRLFALDALVYTPKEVELSLKRNNPFIKGILTEGKVLYAR